LNSNWASHMGCQVDVSQVSGGGHMGPLHP
jgi:hypothetical protein